MEERTARVEEAASTAPSRNGETNGEEHIALLERHHFPSTLQIDRRVLLCASAFMGMLFVLLFFNLDIFLYQLNGPSNRRSSFKSTYVDPASFSPPSFIGDTPKKYKNTTTINFQDYALVRSSNFELTFNIFYEIFVMESTGGATGHPLQASSTLNPSSASLAAPSSVPLSSSSVSSPSLSEKIGDQEKRQRIASTAILSGKGTATLLIQHTPYQKLSLSILDLKLNSPYSDNSQELLLNGITLEDSHQISLFGQLPYATLTALDDIPHPFSPYAIAEEEGETLFPSLQQEHCTFSGIFSYPLDPRRGKSFRITDDKYFQSYQKLLDTSSVHFSPRYLQSYASSNKTSAFLDSAASAFHPPAFPEAEEDEHMEKVTSELVSNDCSLLLRFTGKEIDLQALMNELASFSFVYNIKTIVEVRLLWQQIRFSNAANSYIRISVVSILLGALLDMLEASFLLYVGILWQTTLSYFTIMVVLKLLLFILEMRYAYTVWEAHISTINTGGLTTSRSLQHMFRAFYVSLPFGVFFAYLSFRYMHYLLLIFYIFWIPQICSDIWFGHRNSLDSLYVVIMSVLRIILPLYMFGVSSSIFSTENLLYFESLPDAPIAIAIGMLVMAQCIFCFLQKKFGPRLLIPLKCLPHVYNFYRPFPAVLYEEGAQECVICINKVDLSDKKVCITPCDHLFHSKCLQQWMDVKMECPTCRRVLPAFG